MEPGQASSLRIGKSESRILARGHAYEASLRTPSLRTIADAGMDPCFSLCELGPLLMTLNIASTRSHHRSKGRIRR
jgi:hypothetical protein